MKVEIKKFEDLKVKAKLLASQLLEWEIEDNSSQHLQIRKTRLKK